MLNDVRKKMMMNESKALNKKVCEDTCKLPYKSPAFITYGNIEDITQSNGKGENTDSAAYQCSEANPAVCNS